MYIKTHQLFAQLLTSSTEQFWAFSEVIGPI